MTSGISDQELKQPFGRAVGAPVVSYVLGQCMLDGRQHLRDRLTAFRDRERRAVIFEGAYLAETRRQHDVGRFTQQPGLRDAPPA